MSPNISMLVQAGKGRPIIVTHVDRIGNDWNQLCRTITGGTGDDCSSYLQGGDDIYGHALAKSFYEQVAPSNSISLAYSGELMHVPLPWVPTAGPVLSLQASPSFCPEACWVHLLKMKVSAN